MTKMGIVLLVSFALYYAIALLYHTDIPFYIWGTCLLAYSVDGAIKEHKYNHRKE